jgi:hypothetical protein
MKKKLKKTKNVKTSTNSKPATMVGFYNKLAESCRPEDFIKITGKIPGVSKMKPAT